MITLTNGVQIPENAVQLQTTAAIDGYYVTQPLRLVQYDETLPVAAVQLTYQNQPYTPPTGAELNIRMGKPDGTTVYNPCLGMDSSGIVYFAFTQQMTIVAGTGTLTVEITDSGVKNSAPIIAEIRPNPVPEGSIESADEFLTLQEILAEAEKWGQIVQTNASNIQQVVDNLTDIQNAAENAQQAAASAAAAQQAAQEALGFRTFFSAVTPDANGNLDPSRPMTVGPAESLTIESKGDRIQSVTALGFTQQAGTGDPSPTNVRPITNGGKYFNVTVYTGQEYWSKYRDKANTFSASLAGATIYGGVSSCYAGLAAGELGTKNGIYLSNTSLVIVTDLSCSSADEFKAKLQALYAAGTPLMVWYNKLVNGAEEKWEPGKTLYTPVVLQGGEYRAACLPLTAPLCEGDSVVSWARSGCDVEVVLTGTEGWILNPNSGTAASGSRRFQLGMSVTSSNASAYAVAVAYCSHFEGTTPANSCGSNYDNTFSVQNADLQLRVAGISTVDALKQFLAARYAAGNPVIVWYRSTNYTDAADIPVSLETHVRAVLVLDGTESVSKIDAWYRVTSPQKFGVYGRFISIASGGPWTTATLCSMFKPGNPYDTTGQNVAAAGYQNAGIGNELRIGFDAASDPGSASGVVTLLAQKYEEGTPLQFTVPLATPITYAHPAVVLEAATGDQLTYTVTGQSGGTVSVALKPFQDGGHAKTADSATTAQNATQFDGHAWSEVPGQAPVQSVNGKTGAVTLGAADVGAVPLNHTAVLADGIALKDGSPVNTPADIDHYTVLRIHSNHGVAVCSVPIKGGQTGFLPFINGASAPYINIAVVNISRTETQLTLETKAALRLATTGITAPGTALSVYRIEGLV